MKNRLAILGLLVLAALAAATFPYGRVGISPLGVSPPHVIQEAMAIGPQPGTSGTPCGPGVFYYGNVVTAVQWLTCFQSLQASLGYVPVNQAGDTMQGPLGVTQIVGSSGTPGVTPGAGAGTGGTTTLHNAHDSDFELDVTTGTSPAGSNAAIATVAFSVPYVQNTHCAFSPIENDAASLTTTQSVIGASGTANWVRKSGSSGLTASTTYKWDVVCMG